MKVKFLTVIWGDRYIDEFARISLPSYLAPGNLPYVARETQLEIVILTSAEGQRHFNTLRIMDELRTLCLIRFILIDDLITTGVYGVTLTLAYARGILDTGAEQTNTHFLFMNSDFVLADGSLRATIAKLREGYPCVMAPSLRASAESTLPALAQALSADGHVLNMPPREMVQLAFDNLHPTVVAKTVTQDFVNCETHNQIYWQVDETTLLARYHLIFMLAIKPEVPMGRINSYCDYGFVPELVPSSRFGFMDDSQDFFMLELQPLAQERSMLRCGRKSPDQIAAELSRWTTREHRRFAEVDLVFSSGGSRLGLKEVRAAAARFMAGVQSRMKVPAVNHVDHYYWVGGVQAWASLKFAPEADVILPPELDRRLLPQRPPQKTTLRVFRPWELGWYSDFLGALRRHIGLIPDVPIWHHHWLDSRLLLDWIHDVKSEAAPRVLLLCDDNSSLLRSLPKHLDFDTRNVNDDRDSFEPAPEGYDRILIHVERANVVNLRSRLALADRHLGAKGTISVFIEHKNSELDSIDLSIELSQNVDHLLPPKWMGCRLDGRFVGGRLKRRLRLYERSLYGLVWPASARRVPLMVVGAGCWAVVAGLTALNNLWRRKPSSDCPACCSSVMLSLSKRNSIPSDESGSASHGHHTAVRHLLPGE